MFTESKAVNEETVKIRQEFMPDSNNKGGIHIMGEICPWSDPYIAQMRYYLGPLKLKYKCVMTYTHNVLLGMGFGMTIIFPC